MIYFDNAASTKCDQRVIQKILPFFDIYYANPSAYHKCGKDACEAIENARHEISSYLLCAPTEIIFTSGATEANNLAIKSCALLCNKVTNKNVIISEIEHKSVLGIKDWLKCQGYEVRLARAQPSGIIDLDYLIDLMDDNTLLCSVMYINNETGIIQPVDIIGDICKEKNIIFHVDATQAFGKYQINIKDINPDFLTASAHKLHGPKGSGILYKSNDIEFECIIDGGSQEDGKRAGTENVPGIIGFGEAVRIAKIQMQKSFEYMLSLENYFLSELKRIGILYQLNGDLSHKTPWIFNIDFGIPSDDLMDQLPDFCFSKSSACSKNFKPSHVLEAMSIDEEIIKNSVRISFSKFTLKEEITELIKNLKILQEKFEVV